MSRAQRHQLRAFFRFARGCNGDCALDIRDLDRRQSDAAGGRGNDDEVPWERSDRTRSALRTQSDIACRSQLPRCGREPRRIFGERDGGNNGLLRRAPDTDSWKTRGWWRPSFRPMQRRRRARPIRQHPQPHNRYRRAAWVVRKISGCTHIPGLRAVQADGFDTEFGFTLAGLPEGNSSRMRFSGPPSLWNRMALGIYGYFAERSRRRRSTGNCTTHLISREAGNYGVSLGIFTDVFEHLAGCSTWKLSSQ